MTRRLPGALATVALALVVVGCSAGSPDRTSDDAGSSSPSPTASPTVAPTVAVCRRVETTLVAAVQTYVDGFGGPLTSSTRDDGSARPGRPSASTTPTPTPTPSPSPATPSDQPSGSPSAEAGAASGDEGGPGDAALREAVSSAQQRLQTTGCDVDRFRDGVSRRLDRVETATPLARAVLLRLTASLTGSLEASPRTVRVRPRDDVARTVATLAPGSTVRLTAGRHRLDQPLVLLSAITLDGAGPRRTYLSSSAAGSTVLVLTDGRVELADLTVRHTGRRPAAVVIGGPSSSIVLTRTRVTGAASRGTDGGSGVAMTSGTAGQGDRGTTLEMTRSEVSGNSTAGVLVSGDHRVSVRRTRFAANGQCGVCFDGRSGGAVRDSSFTGGSVGVAALDRARPRLLRLRFTGGQVALQVSGRAAPVVRGLRSVGATRAAMIFGGDSSGRVDGSRCTRTPYGIVVTGRAFPLLGANGCVVAQG